MTSWKSEQLLRDAHSMAWLTIQDKNRSYEKMLTGVLRGEDTNNTLTF